MIRLLLWFVGTLLLVALTVPAVGASEPPSSVSGNLVFLTSPDAPGPVDRARMNACVKQMAQAMRLDLKAMPLVIVIHVSQSAGKAVGARESSIRRNSGPDGVVYYELWLVGPAGVVEYVRGVESVLELHFALHYTEADRAKMMTQVLRTLQATVDVKAFRD